VVDAIDGHPIDGVHATGSHDAWQPSAFLGVPVLCQSETKYAASDNSGLVQFDAGGGGQSDVKFEKAGYKPCDVASSWPGYRESGWFNGLRWFRWEDQATAVVKLQPLRHD
jgi:hypothetical protein